MKKQDCHCCGGTGQETDQRSLGLEMRRLREKANISLREMAYRLEISPPFLSDLEHGNRKWSRDREMAFLEIVREAGEKGKT